VITYFTTTTTILHISGFLNESFAVNLTTDANKCIQAWLYTNLTIISYYLQLCVLMAFSVYMV